MAVRIMRVPMVLLLWLGAAGTTGKPSQLISAWHNNNNVRHAESICMRPRRARRAAINSTET